MSSPSLLVVGADRPAPPPESWFGIRLRRILIAASLGLPVAIILAEASRDVFLWRMGYWPSRAVTAGLVAALAAAAGLIVLRMREEAMERLTKPERPDLIVLDLIMPKLSGFEVLKRIKADPGTSAIPVIVLSKLSQESDRRQVLEAGAVEYLVKANMTLKEVVERIEAVLKNGGRP